MSFGVTSMCTNQYLPHVNIKNTVNYENVENSNIFFGNALMRSDICPLCPRLWITEGSEVCVWHVSLSWLSAFAAQRNNFFLEKYNAY